jgi:hypothetical protein
MSHLVQHALSYAERGWHVFPLKPRSKEPATQHGVKDATTDVGTIVDWWADNPEYNIGINVGYSGLSALDVDPRNGGAVPTEVLGDPDTPMVHTPSGGVHLYYREPGEGRWRKTAGEGLDFQHGNKYLVAPPSIHPDGGQYEWEISPLGVDPQPVPGWLIELVTKPEPKQAVGKQDLNGTRPGDYFNRDADWDYILGTVGGWTWLGPGDEGQIMWRRPGKDDGQSATTGWEGTNLLWVFTTSTEFEADTSYTPFAAYTLLTEGGLEEADYKRAADSLKDRYGPGGGSIVSKSLSVSREELQAAGWAGDVGERLLVKDGEVTELPPLELEPSKYEFEHAFPVEHWISQYIEYAAAQTDAALEYHEATALSMIATVTAGVRCELAPWPEGLPCNLYLLLAGPSTRSRKSTARRIGNALLDKVYPGAVLADRFTGEGAIFMLAQRSGAPATWMPDEFGMTIAEMGSRDFMQVLEQLLLQLYSGDDYTYVKVDGETVVRDVALNILGAATPESLALAGSSTAVLGGLMPRFGVVYPDHVPDARKVGDTPDLELPRAALLAGLRKMQAVTQTPGACRDVKFTDEAFELLNETEPQLSGEVLTARLGPMLYKVAALSALARADKQHLVSLRDAESAAKVVLRWKNGAEHLRPALRRKASDIEFDGILADILKVIKRAGGIAPRFAISKELRLEPRSATRSRDALVEWGQLELHFVEENSKQVEYWRAL